MATRADEVVIDDMSTGFATQPQPAASPVEPVAVETEQPEAEAPQAEAPPVPSPNIETDTPSTPVPVPEVPVQQQDGYNFFPYETTADVVYPQAAEAMAEERPPDLDPKQMFPSMYYGLEEQGKFEGDDSQRQGAKASIRRCVFDRLLYGSSGAAGCVATLVSRLSMPVLLIGVVVPVICCSTGTSGGRISLSSIGSLDSACILVGVIAVPPTVAGMSMDDIIS